MNHRITFIVAALLVLSSAACDGSTAPSPTSPPPSFTPEPTPTPTTIPTPTPVFWWGDLATQDADGNWWPPEEVVEMVRDDYNTGAKERYEIFFASEPPDLDAYEARLPAWYSGPYLATFLESYIPDVRVGNNTLNAAEWEKCVVQVDDFSPDGLECRLARTCRNGTRYHHNFVKEELTSEYVEQMGTVVFRMRYDSVDACWKLHEFLEFIPP